MSPSLPQPFGDLAPPRRAHLVGILGSGMQSLAALLLQHGWQLTGSDANPRAGRQCRQAFPGVTFYGAHAAENVPVDCELVIHTAAVPSENPELSAARRRGVPVCSYVDMLAALMSTRFGVSIAGTHGKSSTTAMVQSILEAAARPSISLFGAQPIKAPQSVPLTNGPEDVCVVESCEFRSHFLRLRPKLICLTGIEPDHFDCFATIESARAAYARFLNLLPSNGILVFNASDNSARELAESVSCQTVSYSRHDSAADWSATRIEQQGGRLCLKHQNREVGAVDWNQWGLHQIDNGLAAAATCSAMGVPVENIVQGLSAFAGLRRRLEPRGCVNGVRYFDDYAHHPTAIQSVLESVLARFTGEKAKLWVVFQPHQANRTRHLMQEFANSLTLADEVFILPVFGARESASTEFVELAKQLTLHVQRLGTPASFVPGFADLQQLLTTSPSAGDTVLTLGAGDIDQIYL
ncbi:MAG: UDP-N-acetylmuramate--L-alanine ligase [Planctomycetaceae bacterium]